MSQDERTNLRLRVEGRVQSVGYRNFAIAEAKKLSLDGWVRNRFDGTVEILISGPNADVETFVGACMQGPAGSAVENVEIHRADPPQNSGFVRRPSL